MINNLVNPLCFSKEILQRFPSDFLDQFDQKNNEKKTGAPSALILTGESDLNNNLYGSPSQFFILTIAKTHRIGLRIIKRKEDIPKAIDEEKTLNKKSIQALFFYAHGNSSGLQLGNEETYSSTDIKPNDFEGLDPNAEIFLFSCQSGKGLAQKIADITNRIVFATPMNLSPVSTSFSFCK